MGHGYHFPTNVLSDHYSNRSGGYLHARIIHKPAVPRALPGAPAADDIRRKGYTDIR